MDKHEKLERAVTETLRIETAIDKLEGVRDMDYVVDILKDRMIVLGFERDEYHRQIEEEDAREEAALVREYWRMVI